MKPAESEREPNLAGPVFADEEIAGLLNGVANAATRPASVDGLCAWLGCEALIIFLPDPDLAVRVPAEGFPQTLPNGRVWRTFLRACQEAGEHLSDVSWPGRAAVCAASGFAAPDGSVLVVTGSSTAIERCRALLCWIPLVTTSLKKEKVAFLATQQALLDRQTMARSKLLAEQLDAVATQNARLLHEAENNLAEKERLEADQRRFVALVNNSSDLIGLFTAGGEVLFLNQSGLSMIGLTSIEQARTRRFEQFFAAGQRSFARDRVVHETLQTGRWTGEAKFANEVSGVLVDVHQTTFLITSAQEPEPILATIARDITESKKAEARLRHAAKLESLGVMAGGIAHDFNNLLTGILGNASLLLSTVSPEDAVLAQEIVKGSERAAHLTRQMLAYSGRGRFQIKHLDLSVEVREVLDMVKASIAKNVAVNLELRDGLPAMEGDPGQIQQLIMNLVINGSDAMNGKAGEVNIRTRALEVDRTYSAQTFGVNQVEPGQYVSLEVHDTGCGMTEETQARIFDPFFTTKFAGRGLGLAAVSGIIRGHRGALRLYSAPGRGTTFKVIFPAVAARAPVKSRVPVKDLGGKATILVVDDEPVVRQVTKVALEKEGYKVIAAEDGVRGVEVFTAVADEIALIILDLTMPRMGGEEALAHLRAVRSSIPVLISSGYNEAEVIRRFADQQVDGFIEKPYTATILLTKVQEVLQSSARR